MGQYDSLNKIILPANIFKTVATSSIPTPGRNKTTAGVGNEGVDLGLWIQEKIIDGTIVIDLPDLTSLITLTGLPAGTTTLGSFTGSIITDNTSIVNAFQELETFIEGLGSGGNSIYTSSGTVPTTVVATLTDNITFTTDTASGFFLANSGNLFGSYLLVNDTQAKLQFYDVSSTNQVIVDSGGIQLNTLTPDRVTITGLDARYNADYSAFYSNRSLVDKEYVDNLLASGLPSGSSGDLLVHNGTNYVSISPINESQSGITGTGVTLAATPLSYAQFSLFKNGLLQTSIDDYSLAGSSLTMTVALISTDKITAIYYI